MTRVFALDPDDWPIWRELRLRALEDAPEAFGSTLADVLERDTERHWRAGVSAPMVPFVAEHDGVPAAMGRLMVPESHDAPVELISVWVAPEHRGRGVGRALITAAAEHHALQHPRARLLLAVVETNVPARALYSRCGFTVIGRNPDDAAELLMEHGAP